MYLLKLIKTYASKIFGSVKKTHLDTLHSYQSKTFRLKTDAL